MLRFLLVRSSANDQLGPCLLFIFYTMTFYVLDFLFSRWNIFDYASLTRDEWLVHTKFKDWMANDHRADNKVAICSICMKRLSIANMGKYALESHAKSYLHKKHMLQRSCASASATLIQQFTNLIFLFSLNKLLNLTYLRFLFYKRS